MRDNHIDLCGQIDFTRTEAMPLLAREGTFQLCVQWLRRLLSRAGGYRVVRL